MKKNLFILVFLSFFTFSTTYSSYSIYYGMNQKLAKKTFTSDLVILQDYNFDLYTTYKGKKICYLSVGESDETSESMTELGLDSAVLSKNVEWNTSIMDMSNETWIEFVLNKEKKLKDLGCNGLFLDTLWQENQEDGGIEIVKKIKENWLDSYIIVNNAHYIKNEIKNSIDGFMFENFWDYGTKIKSEDGDWYISLFKEYYQLSKEGKKLYALTYSDPKKIKTKAQKKWYDDTRMIAKIFNFELVYSSYNLDSVY